MSVVVLIKAKDVISPSAGQIDKSIVATEAKAGVVKLKNSITAQQEDAAVTEKAVREFVGSSQNGLDIGQAWQDVTSDRQNNVIYTNTSNKTIAAKIITTRAGGSFTCKYYIGDTMVFVQDSYQMYTDYDMIIPPNTTYKIEIVGGNLNKWLELR